MSSSNNPLDQPEVPTPNGTPLAIADEPAQPTHLEAGVTTLDVGTGDAVKLDRLGPMIVNSDGTLSRISNWLELTQGEQERTVRLLVKKRNLVRIDRLQKEEDARAAAEQSRAA